LVAHVHVHHDLHGYRAGVLSSSSSSSTNDLQLAHKEGSIRSNLGDFGSDFTHAEIGWLMMIDLV
jgi:hypothetical protein